MLKLKRILSLRGRSAPVAIRPSHRHCETSAHIGRGNLSQLFVILFCAFVLAGCFAGCQKDQTQTYYVTVSDLEGCRVGVTTGTTFDVMAQQTWENCELVYLNSFNDLIPALTSNKIDCFITDKPWITYLSSANSDITYIDETLTQEDYGLIFAKNDEGAALRDDFNAFLEENSGTQELLLELETIWFDADETKHPEIDYEALPATNGVLRICTEVSNPPFEYYENGRIVGYNVQLLYLYCQSRGYGMELDDMKFDSLIPAVSSGKYDIASSSFTITAERAESVYFSDPIYESGPVVAIRTENSPPPHINDEVISFWSRVATSFKRTFIRENRWKLFVDGIGLTLLITVLSLAAGTLFGFVLYMWYRHGKKFCRAVTGFLSWLISGMPEVLLLLILFYVVFGNSAITGTWVSVIAFTLIVGVDVFGRMKSGVEAVDRGQMEAALAIGYSERRGFFRIILPQALQYIMPGYRGSIVSLIKSTAIVGYLAVQDLTKVSDIIRSRTYEAFFPLIATAAIYFVLAWLLVELVNHMQGKLLPIRNSRKTILKGIEVEEEDLSDD